MRHSQPTASKNYLKVFDEELNLIITNLKLEKDILKGDIKILKSKMIKCDEIEQKNNKQFKKRRADILHRISNKGVIPKNNTLELYQIKYDTQNNKYIVINNTMNFLKKIIRSAASASNVTWTILKYADLVTV